MHSLLLLVCIGSNTFSAISGLSLASKNSIITTTDFSLVCTIQGSLTTTISIKNPSGSIVGSCVPPPVGCGSGLGNTVVSSTADGITKVTIDMDRRNINIPSSEGSWSCSNGTNEVFFQVKLFSITKPKVWTDSATALTGSEVNVEIDCIYPYPSLIRIDYIQESTRAVLKSTTGLTFTNGTASNCNVIDTRAISMKGTFKLTDDKLNGAKVLIAAVVLVNGDVLDTGYSNFTYQPKDCSEDIFLCGFLPVFLIEVIEFIAFIIILKIKHLPRQFGEFTWKKLGIIIAFLVIAIIIGICLGLLIKECDKKFLALGLSLFFGILLVVALIFALIYYHKKCESRSDIQDGDGGEDSNRFSLDSCFRKCKVKPEKEISSQNNTGSNTTRTGTGRVGSPASTSNVELAANLKSEY